MHTDSTNVKRGSKAAQSEATRAKLVKVARRLFAKRGYSAVGTEEVVKKAGVTRGALYHQFDDKKDLFRAVLIETAKAFLHSYPGAVWEELPADRDEALVLLRQRLADPPRR